MPDDIDQRRARTQAARHAALARHAERAASDPQKLDRAIRIVRAAIAAGRLHLEELNA